MTLIRQWIELGPIPDIFKQILFEFKIVGEFSGVREKKLGQCFKITKDKKVIIPFKILKHWTNELSLL
jgi:hypothetical protein